MPIVYRPWVSPYGDGDFEWDRNKSLRTFGDRDLVFEAARIVFGGPSVRRQDTRPPLARTQVYGPWRVVWAGHGH
jgi:uncharacterized DUF497 family protein